ncbi:TRZ/ATZ family hydrolase [Chitinimonas sp.]|uniref:TRZ/ATZ family hydrolase n=1 Tax=Chitinimonas sp. TaxID=1934313 RepID=UPI0035B4BFC1
MSLTVLFPRWIVPVVPQGTVLEAHALVMDGTAISAILPADVARQRYANAELLELPEHVLLPGLVNLHAHSAMTLLRGVADDLALMDWLNNHIWPAEKQHLSDEFVFDGSLLAMAEMLQGGTTTVNDMYFHHDAVARAGLQAGMRTVVGASILEFPTGYGNNADDYIRKGLAAREHFLGEGLLSFTLAPHAPYTVADDTFKKVVTLAEQLELGIHCHVHETASEVSDSVQQYGERPLARLHRLGVLGPNLIAAHMVHANDEELALLARQGVHVAHNPASNLKLASGIARTAAMLKAGVNVGIGTDGAASNNSLDMLADTRLAALIAKGSSGDPTAVPAPQALEMATLGGARALGMAERIGSLEAGKQADLIAVDLGSLPTLPVFDPISHLVYAAQRNQVSHVWVAGRALVQQHKLLTLNAGQLAAKAHWWQTRISANGQGGK